MKENNVKYLILVLCLFVTYGNFYCFEFPATLT